MRRYWLRGSRRPSARLTLRWFAGNTHRGRFSDMVMASVMQSSRESKSHRQNTAAHVCVRSLRENGVGRLRQAPTGETEPISESTASPHGTRAPRCAPSRREVQTRLSWAFRLESEAQPRLRRVVRFWRDSSRQRLVAVCMFLGAFAGVVRFRSDSLRQCLVVACVCLGMFAGCATTSSTGTHLPDGQDAVVGIDAIASLSVLVPGEPSMVLSGTPERFASAPTLRDFWGDWIDEGVVRATEFHVGLRPERIEQAVWANYDDGGWMLFVRGPADMARAVHAAEMRMSTVAFSSDHPLIRRAGHEGTKFRDYVALAGDVLLIAQDSGGRVAQLLAMLRRGIPVDAVSEVGATAIPMLKLVVPRHLGLPLDTGLGMVLSRQEGLRVRVGADEFGVKFQGSFWGEFPDGVEQNLTHWFGSMSASSLGQALGLDHSRRPLSVRHRGDEVSFEITLAAERLREGLRTLFTERWSELLEQ